MGWGVGETGRARAQFDESQADRLQHAVKIAVHIIVCEPQNGETLGNKRRCSPCVVSDFPFGRMRRAVDFDDQSGVQTGEVGDEAAKRDLASKSIASDLFAAQALPKATFSTARVATQ